MPAQPISLGRSYWLLMLLPLAALPIMINIRIFPFVAPNEEPKWALLTIYGLLSAIALATWLWHCRQRPRIRLGISGILLLTWYIILTIGIFIGVNPVEGAIRYGFWVFNGLLWLVAIQAVRQTAQWMNFLCWSTCISAFIFSCHYWWNYVMDYGKIGYNYSVLFSPIGHVNFTGDALIILLPALLWMLATRHNLSERIFNWFSSCTLFTILLIASSRGALGGIALSVLVFVAVATPHVWRQRNASSNQRNALIWPTLRIVSVLIAAVIIYLLLPYHYRDLGRVTTDNGQYMTKTLAKTSSAIQPPLEQMWRTLTPLIGFDRTSMYASSSAMIADRPLLGHGTGNFAWLYPAYSNRFPDFRDPLSTPRTFTTNPHNLFLQIATQNGLPAALIFIGLLLLFWFALLRRVLQQWDGWLAAGLMALTSAIFDAMFNHVFFNPASMFLFALYGGAWWGKLFENHETTIAFRIAPRLWAGNSLIVALALSAWPTMWILSEWHVGRAMILARQPNIAAIEYNTAYRLDPDNFRALFGVAQSAYQHRQYGKVIKYLTAFENIYPYNPPALNLLGVSYMLSGKYIAAEATLQMALVSYPGFTAAEKNLAMLRALILQRSRHRTTKAHP
ncbi:MAG: O-antigen ligase family protein [Mariprofundales bacterium]|nr:O-antigen ligase family protein [Mariprofundales bacterium]